MNTLRLGKGISVDVDEIPLFVLRKIHDTGPNSVDRM